MYVPQSFVETDQTTLHEFIEQHSFATLISHGGQAPQASHLPLLLEPSDEGQGTLLGHMAKANVQWQQADGQSVLAIFHGPHTYISPTWYQATGRDAERVVPTWNYVTVHAIGTFQLIEDRERLHAVVQRTVETYERDMPDPWAMAEVDAEFQEQLLDGIVGFEIVIDELQGKWKLNQNHDEARRRNVIQALQQAGGEDQRAIAELMTQTLEREA